MSTFNQISVTGHLAIPPALNPHYIASTPYEWIKIEFSENELNSIVE